MGCSNRHGQTQKVPSCPKHIAQAYTLTGIKLSSHLNTTIRQAGGQPRASDCIPERIKTLAADDRRTYD